jgi:tetratricopeptide (TPR) repeat protein
MFKIAELNDTRDQFQALALTDFAGTLSKLGRAKEAIEIAEKAMDIWHSIPNMPEEQFALMGMTMSQLGIAHECNGDYQVALECYRKALAAKIETYGEDSLEAATGFNNVGYALTECGQLSEASEKLEKCRAILTNLELQNTSSWAHLIENLGDLHRAKGNLDEAEKELMESLKLRKKRFKEDLHHTYHDLGKLYRDKKDWKSSESYFEKALSIREKRYTAPTAQTLQEFAKLMVAMGKNTEASSLQKRAEDLLANTR